eukprot:scaffold11571_cov119-Isochrysis_galbana.AAC.5
MYSGTTLPWCCTRVHESLSSPIRPKSQRCGRWLEDEVQDASRIKHIASHSSNGRESPEGADAGVAAQQLHAVVQRNSFIEQWAELTRETNVLRDGVGAFVLAGLRESERTVLPEAAREGVQAISREQFVFQQRCTGHGERKGHAAAWCV